MTRTSAQERLARLEQLTALLKERERFIVKDLAAEMGVSTRTLFRDLDVLRERGLPIESDRGRGGGIRLHRHWGVGRVELSFAEAVDLLISLAIAEKVETPLFLTSLQSVRRKITASFSPNLRAKVAKLRSRVLIGAPASPMVTGAFTAPSREPFRALHQAFLEMTAVRISYTDEAGTKTRRTIEAHYLYFNFPVWYVLAWDHLRRDTRCFRIDRVGSAMALDEEFTLRSRKEFQAMMEDLALPF